MHQWAPGAIGTSVESVTPLTASRNGDGLVVHRLERPLRDDTTECLFEPLDLFATRGGKR